MPKEIKSLRKGLMLYKEILSYSKPILAKTLCERLSIDKSTMSRLLQTLKNENFIEYLENSNEIIACDLENNAIKNTKIELLVKNTQNLLEDIFSLTNECAYLGIIHNNKVLYLNQIDRSDRDLKTRNNIGLYFPVHSSALGKSILAFGNYDLNKMRLKQWTNNTITNLAALKKDLNNIREKGYSIDNSEFQDSMCCIGVPLFNKDNILIAAVGISGTSARIKKQSIEETAQNIIGIVEKYSILS